MRQRGCYIKRWFGLFNEAVVSQECAEQEMMAYLERESRVVLAKHQVDTFSVEYKKAKVSYGRGEYGLRGYAYIEIFPDPLRPKERTMFHERKTEEIGDEGVGQ